MLLTFKTTSAAPLCAAHLQVPARSYAWVSNIPRPLIRKNEKLKAYHQWLIHQVCACVCAVYTAVRFGQRVQLQGRFTCDMLGIHLQL